jgi:hypothetical protein
MVGAGFEPALNVFAVKLSFSLNLYSYIYSRAKPPKKQALS